MAAPKTTAPTIAAGTSAAHSLASVCPEWLDLSQRYAALCHQEARLLHEVAQLNADIDATAQHDTDPRSAGPRITIAPPVKRLSEAARQLLGDRAPVEPPPQPVAEPIVRHDDHRVARLIELGKEIDALREAKPILLEQLNRARAGGSKQLCEALRPGYAAIIGRMANAVIALGDASLAHQEFLQAHAVADLGYLRPPAIEGVADDPRDPASTLRRFLVTAAEAGYFELAQTPGAWLKAIPAPEVVQPPALPKVKRGFRLGRARYPDEATGGLVS